MISRWEIYCLLKLDTMGEFFSSLSVVSFFIASFLFFIMVVWNVNEETQTSRPMILKISTPAFILMFLFSMVTAVTIPNTKQAVTIWLLPKVVNNENMQNVPERALEILNKKMGMYLKDLEEQTLGGKSNE